MFRGFHTAASGMIAQQRRTEMMTNNLANANTPGYKAEQSSIRTFPEMLLSSKESRHISSDNISRLNGKIPVGSVSTGVYMQETLPSWIQGQLQKTDMTTDLALIEGRLPTDEETGVTGAILFTLEHESGAERYTKNGNFTLDADGYLTSATGHYVLDQNGDRIALQNDNFTVTETGTILSSGGEEVATLGIAFTQRPDQLMKQDNGVFATVDGESLQSAAENDDVTFILKQSYLERSNVDAGRTMTDLLTSYRAFEANQKVLQAYDRSMEKAVTEVGRVN